ncbi:hypothetical protein HAX54_007803 [Datura stramonium]|uniref:U1-type domain-containing protein n=1 Tax=Datura stramonium TaxID=4076 RepID=A0ABS8RIN6_DATST|nr:hypothetical protein [Datura stramonium]
MYASVRIHVTFCTGGIECARTVYARGTSVQRKPLKPRDYQVDLESRLGKTQAECYCPVCECVVKDSANYLDHINGKKHFDERMLKQQQEEEERKRLRREKKKEKKVCSSVKLALDD